MAIEDIQIAENVTFTEALEILENNNLSQLEINTLIWGVLGETLGKTKRVFNYSETFASEVEGCEAEFTRSFVHTDWIDGESIVQAEENSIEEGFNSRFHKIEADLDALAGDILKAFGCIADMRGDLADRLTELRTEINKINSDVFECCQEEEGGGGGVVYPGPYYPYPYPYEPPMYQPPIGTYPVPGDPLGPWITDNPWINEDQIWWNDRPWTNPGSLGDWLGSIGKTTYPGPAVTRSVNDPTRATVAGMPARRLDVQMFNGQTYEVWSTSSGIVITPAETGVNVGDQVERSWTSQRSKVVGDVAEWATDNAKQLDEVFEGGTTVGAIVEKFGEDRLDGGGLLAEALAALPSSTKLENAGQLLGALADRAATAVTRDGLAAETLVANIGFTKDFASFGEVPLTEYKAMPLRARKVLAEAGVQTMGAFQKLGAAEVVRLLARGGMEVSVGEVARWSGEARVVGAVAGRVDGIGREPR